ncbi:hypothetical protein ACIPLC_36055 [Kitasatospora sp. NPDC086801]|uniref:hypothetical protein n=1 Tax=Kitasatospora sp. NPDC086801 TaxID=3364066 RepID=UPI003823AB4E
MDEPKPPVVVICGSTKFWEQMQEANLHETAAGRIVLAPGCDMKRPHQLWEDPVGADALKQRLDALHRAKIRMADEVLLVTDEAGYVGESTSRELEYAKALGLPIRRWTGPSTAATAGQASPGEDGQPAH